MPHLSPVQLILVDGGAPGAAGAAGAAFGSKDWFTLDSRPKGSLHPSLTNVLSAVHPLLDVKGVLHVAVQDVKLDVVCPQVVVRPIGRHSGPQEDDLCREKRRK